MTDRLLSARAELSPLGDQAMLVRFGTSLDETANQAALAFAAHLAADPIAGVTEVVPSLVSVLLRYDPGAVDYWRLAGEVSLRTQSSADLAPSELHRLAVRFDGADIAEVAQTLGLSVETLIAQHNAAPLRVLTTGFAPGFVYCGFHPSGLHVPRRQQVRASVPAGSVLFAAGQTAIAATAIPTGWHVIGHTDFRNFQPEAQPPTVLRAGDLVQFEVAR